MRARPHLANGPSSRTSSPITTQLLLDILGQHVGFEIHRIADLQRPQRGDLERVRNQGHAEPIGLHIDQRQAHAIHGDRSLAGHLPRQWLAAHGTRTSTSPDRRSVRPSLPHRRCAPSRNDHPADRRLAATAPGSRSSRATSRPRFVRLSVSAPASNPNDSACTSTTVRQHPLTAMLLPICRSRAIAGARITSRTPGGAESIGRPPPATLPDR